MNKLEDDSDYKAYQKMLAGFRKQRDAADALVKQTMSMINACKRYHKLIEERRNAEEAKT